MGCEVAKAWLQPHLPWPIPTNRFRSAQFFLIQGISPRCTELISFGEGIINDWSSINYLKSISNAEGFQRNNIFRSNFEELPTVQA